MSKKQGRGIVPTVAYTLAIIAFFGAIFIYSHNQVGELQRRDAATKQVTAECDTKGGDYGTYYDNGGSEVPVCRTPSSDKEWQDLKEHRAYLRALYNGDIEKPDPDPDDYCVNPRICQ